MYQMLVIVSFAVFFVNVFQCEGHIRSKRVVGGEPISIEKAPWMTMITVKNGHRHCGGTIIGEKAILTSGHCLGPLPADIVVVVIGVGRINETKPENRYSAQKVIPHPEFNSKSYENDIGVVILEKSVDITKYPPINLPSPEMQTYNNACIAGWGFTSYPGKLSNDLQEVCFTSKDFKDCSENWSTNWVKTKTQLCVGEKGKDMCYGDGGGPLYTKVGDKATQIGIISYGKGCSERDSVYTRVSAFVPWILDTISTS